MSQSIYVCVCVCFMQIFLYSRSCRRESWSDLPTTTVKCVCVNPQTRDDHVYQKSFRKTQLHFKHFFEAASTAVHIHYHLHHCGVRLSPGSPGSTVLWVTPRVLFWEIHWQGSFLIVFKSPEEKSYHTGILVRQVVPFFWIIRYVKQHYRPQGLPVEYGVIEPWTMEPVITSWRYWQNTQTHSTIHIQILSAEVTFSSLKSLKLCTIFLPLVKIEEAEIYG